MKKFLIKSIIFVAVLFLSFFIIHNILIFGLKQLRTGDYGVWNRIVNGEINADILILGSSRALVHFDCQVIESATGRSCFNIGLNGSRLNLQLPLLKTYLKHNRYPQFLIVSLDCNSLQLSKEIHRPSQYLPYLDEDIIYKNLLQLDSRFWLYKHIPFYSVAAFNKTTNSSFLGYALIGLRGGRVNDARENGYLPRDREWSDEFQNFRYQHLNGISLPIEQEAIDCLKDVVDLCRLNGIYLVLVYPPEYFEAQELTLNRKEIFQLYESIAASAQAPFWDFSDNAISYNKKYFYNSQHLNRLGATVFSKDVASKLVTVLKSNGIRPASN